MDGPDGHPPILPSMTFECEASSTFFNHRFERVPQTDGPDGRFSLRAESGRPQATAVRHASLWRRQVRMTRLGPSYSYDSLHSLVSHSIAWSANDCARSKNALRPKMCYFSAFRCAPAPEHAAQRAHACDVVMPALKTPSAREALYLLMTCLCVTCALSCVYSSNVIHRVTRSLSCSHSHRALAHAIGDSSWPGMVRCPVRLIC